MKRLILAAFLAASPAMAQTANQPITLTPQEYDHVIGELLRRDPVMSLLVQKQQAAQAAVKPVAPVAGPTLPPSGVTPN